MAVFREKSIVSQDAPADCVLSVRDLRITFLVVIGWFGKARELRAVDGIGFDLVPGRRWVS